MPPTPSVPTPAARAVANALTKLLASGLHWEPPPASPVPKLRFVDAHLSYLQRLVIKKRTNKISIVMGLVSYVFNHFLFLD